MAALVIGIAGGMGAGKTHLAQRLCARFGARLISVDDERRAIAGSSADGFESLWAHARDATRLNIRSLIDATDGVVLLEWAMLVEDGFTSLIDKAIVASCPEHIRLDRLEGSDLTRPQIRARMARQLPEGAAAARLLEQGIPTLVLDTSEPLGDQTLFDAYDELADSEFSSSSSFCLFRIPRRGGRVIWEITNSCNYGCRYCIFSSTPRKPDGELCTERTLGVIDELAGQGFTHIKFTGGEPFLRPDLMAILRHARRRGFKTDLSTNAAHIDDAVALELAGLGLEMAHVSLDGHTQAIQESARGARTYAPTVAGIKALAGKGIRLRIGCVVFKGNQSHLMDIASFCHDLGCDEIIFSLMEPAGRMKGQTRLLCDLDGATLRSRIDEISQSLLGKIKVSANLPQPVEAGCGSCPGGARFLFINHKGSVSPCTWVTDVADAFNSRKTLHDASLAAILADAPNMRFRSVVDSMAYSGLDRCPAKIAPVLLLAERVARLFEGDLATRLSAGGRFSEISPLYLFSNENVGAWMSALDVSGRSILLTGGSGDAMICAYAAGAARVSNFDINLLARPMAELRLAMLALVTREDFIEYFEALPFKSYLRARAELSLSARHFIDQAYIWAGGDGAKLAGSALFKHGPSRALLERNISYLATDEAYLLARAACADKPLAWTTHSAESAAGFKAGANKKIHKIHSIHSKATETELFGAIGLSNLADYAHLLYAPDPDYLGSFMTRVANPMAGKLAPGGSLMIAYAFAAHEHKNETSNTELRSAIDDPASRMRTFGHEPGLAYSEAKAQAAWGSGFDTLALWTKA
jgi:MoaA/NifB/PqqE/SkfB family radical SAM enzyme/dephospho-CoA kinase